MREQIWLEWFCRQAARTIKLDNLTTPAPQPDDPRLAFAAYVNQGIIGLEHGAISKSRLLEELWYLGLWPFAAPYGDSRQDIIAQSAPHLALLLTRGCVSLLGDAQASAAGDQRWRAVLGDDRAVYVDIPAGAIVFGGQYGLDAMQLRALLLPPAATLTEDSGRPFVALLTNPGSELPRGRLCGLLELNGQVCSFPGESNADFSLKEPYGHPSQEILARKRSGDLLSSVLGYYCFGPAKSREVILATPRERLRNGKPRNDQGLFAITRLKADLNDTQR